MPAKSKKQFKLMAAVASGNIKKPGLSASEAKEFIGKNKGKRAYKKLPTKVKSKGKGK